MSGMPSDPSAVAPKGLAVRLVGVLTSPRETYAAVAARPRAFGVLAVVLGLAATGSFLLFSSKVGQEALLDQQVQGAEAFGRTISDAQYAQLQRFASFAGYFVVASQAIGLPLGMLAVAGVMYGIFNAAMGGEATFKQVFAIVSHSSVVLLVQSLFVLPLDYARGTIASPTRLLVFVPMLDETTFLGRLLSSIDLFTIWGTISLAIGLGVLYKRRTAPIVTTMLMTYGALALLIAAVRTALAGA